ncbi:hypothetical protein P152DRAFT_495130 [Eremomyces bilateralis CBS 781.70]|uniref:Uncharacterized protein n=1 Tax=Eremomyces bilateralis CBS 781.70 TaxID=1392243 RepID=A0A6G1FU30_9PEZI|nr:uncharacterized protein P152DRAFT_495130 [Eremomyces bilateralis CBS 781.70]KAF1809179.1 hypothetical protein P152DRAFT_495130 [Eremomyces bilateralis CBS 781.70]
MADHSGPFRPDEASTDTHLIASPVYRLPLELLTLIAEHLGNDHVNISNEEQLYLHPTTMVTRPSWTRRRTEAAQRNLLSFCRVSHRFQSAGEPIFYREIVINNHSPSWIVSVICSLLDNPDRQHWVRSLTFSRCPIDHTPLCLGAHEEPDSRKTTSQLPLYIRQPLAEKLEYPLRIQLFRTIGDLNVPFHDSWIDALEHGDEDAEMAALLAIVPNLQEWNLMPPEEYLLRTKHVLSFCMLLVNTAYCRGTKMTMGLPLVLKNLRDVTVQEAWLSAISFSRLLRLPALRRLTFRYCTASNATHSNPSEEFSHYGLNKRTLSEPFASTVEELVLYNMRMNNELLDILPLMIVGASNLKSFRIQMELAEQPVDQILKKLSRSSTLEELEWSCVHPERPHLNESANPLRYLRRFKRLKRLTLCDACICRWLLFGSSLTMDPQIRLPPNLRSLDLHLGSGPIALSEDYFPVLGPVEHRRYPWFVSEPTVAILILLSQEMGEQEMEFLSTVRHVTDAGWEHILEDERIKNGWRELGIEIYVRTYFLRQRENEAIWQGWTEMKERNRIWGS